MMLVCPHCKAELLAEIPVRLLVACPVCEFLAAVSPGGRPEIPTFAEEKSLTQTVARRAIAAGHTDRVDDTVAGHTVVGNLTDAFGEFPLPTGKTLLVEVAEAPREGPPAGTVFRLTKGRTILGRSDADIALEDERISRKHALIEAISRENIYLKDLASTNGTFLNGQRVSVKKLNSGDRIKLGGTTLVFRALDT